MADTSNLDILASQLSREERHDMLDRITRDAAETPGLPARQSSGDSDAIDVQTQFENLTKAARFWYFILSLFKAMQPLEIYRNRLIDKMGKKLEKQFPDIYNHKRGLLLSGFYTRFEKLKEAARFFYNPLCNEVNQDKENFYGYIGSQEMPEIHAGLEEVLNQGSLENICAGIEEKAVRREVLKRVDDILASISPGLKNTMYIDIRYMTCLQKLSAFAFDQTLQSFAKDPKTGNLCSPIGNMTSSLNILNNLLYSLEAAPEQGFFSALFSYFFQKRLGQGGFEKGPFRDEAENALEVIGDFGENVPLLRILRCAGRNMALMPVQVSGGEEWPVIYAKYWKDNAETVISGYLRERRRKEFIKTFGPFLKLINEKSLEYLFSNTKYVGLPVKGILSFSLLTSFYLDVVYPEVVRYLEPIFLNGIFARGENRAEFVDIYNSLLKIEGGITAFKKKISADGLYGQSYRVVQEDRVNKRIQQQKLAAISQEASDEAAEIMDSIRNTSNNMLSLLNDMLNHDILSNIHIFQSKGNKFSVGLRDMEDKFQKLIQILGEIEVLEG